MGDMGTADRTYVCGPDCKALKAPEQPKAPRMTTGEKIMMTFWWTIIVSFAALGAIDVGLRIAVHYWTF